jgi:hypothetical protein
MGASGLSESTLPRARRGTIRDRCLKLGANTRTHNGTPAALLSPAAKTAPPALPVLRLRSLTAYAARKTCDRFRLRYGSA